ncbi:LuxR C-terminal-related transcriptional regulator [Microbispora sp. NPDC049125]|uniref:LuxR C-terminal-related transcriptional regulator n=1 Tax=Microbispora sp. NPDC049125 TaxID=3154929 RepID=UPI00346692E0
MSSPWPFAGRADQLAELRAAGRGVVVLGPAGAGKSRLVAEAVRDVPGVAWARATEAAAELPFGAFAHLLPGSRPGGNPLRWAAAAIDAPTLVVDDAHLLDPASAGLVHLLALHGTARLLVTVRAGAKPPDAVVALWKDELLTRLELAPLSMEETERMLAEALPGRIEAGSLARLWAVSQGNPLYLRELVLSGVLRDLGGLWVWNGPLAMSTSMREIVTARIGDLSGEEREVMELVAFGEPLGAGLLASLCSEAAIERLEQRQLVTVQPSGRRLDVRLAHPLYGEVLRDQCGELRTRTVSRRLADAVAGTGARRREDVLRIAVWRLDAGDAGDSDLLLRACGKARQVRDLTLAERLATAAGEGARARLALANVLTYMDRGAEAEELFRAAMDSGLDDVTRFEGSAMRAINLAWVLGRTDEARAVLAEAKRTTSSRAAWQVLHCFEAGVATLAGDLPAGEFYLADVRREGPADDSAWGALTSSEACLLALTGHGGEAMIKVDRLLTRLAELPDAMPSIMAVVLDAGVTAAIVTGDLRRADRYVDRTYGPDGRFELWDRAFLQFGGRKAEIHRLRGRLLDSIAVCDEAVVRLPERSAYAGPCLSELAHAHALRGDAEAAAAALARAEAHVPPAGPLVAYPLRMARVWTAAARGDLSGAVELALEMGDSPYVFFSLFALHDVVRLGHPELAAAPLARLAGHGPLAELFARHANARGPAELEEVSASFERRGMLLYAAESLARSGALYRQDGRPRDARAAETRAWALAHHCQGARTPALVGLSLPGLTRRQSEIAVLASRGLTNREIAEHLVVSIRTVANTLYTVYERTGVTGREELARVMETLTPPSESHAGNPPQATSSPGV